MKLPLKFIRMNSPGGGGPPKVEIFDADGFEIAAMSDNADDVVDNERDAAMIVDAVNELGRRHQALAQAERFISGFEDDETQEGIGELLALIRSAQNSTTQPSSAPPRCPYEEWTYSAYRATLRKGGKVVAIVTPDGKHALAPSTAAELLRALNSEAVLDRVLHDHTYQGGVQFWMRKHDELLAQISSANHGNA